MCKSCQYCLESCYWHLIEKRFCYDESIALYEDPEKEEKNNNTFENLAFYDSVSVIAGRSIVTIEPFIDKPIVQQPRKTILCDATELVKDVPDSAKSTSLQLPEQEVRKKSLRERRLSRSLYLKIDKPKELPIVRQQSMPKFYVDTPEESVVSFPTSSTLTPVPIDSNGFVYDLYSVVHMEKQRIKNMNQASVHSNKDERSSRLMQIRDKIKLRRVKSSLGSIANSLPHSNHI